MKIFRHFKTIAKAATPLCPRCSLTTGVIAAGFYATLLCVQLAAAAPAEPLHKPAGQTNLLPTNVTDPSRFYSIGGHFGTAHVVAMSGDQSRAIEFDITHAANQPWRAQYLLPIHPAIASGDELELSFKFRAVKPSRRASVSVSLRSRKQGARLIRYAATAGDNWRAVQLRQSIWQAVAANDDGLYFYFGGQKQRIQIADISLRIIKARQKSLHFAGPWLKQAQQRIWLYRMAPLTVRVLDSQGRPWPHAQVHVQMLRHSFQFGSAVDANLIMANTATAHTYRSIFLKYFNHAEMENDLKWPEWHNLASRKVTLKAMAWLKAHHIGIRGHNLVWPNWRYLPHYINSLRNNPAKLRATIAAHVAHETKALARQVDCWDVVNEALANRDLQNILGNSILIDWYKIAHQNDPHALLYINDYGIVTHGGHTRLKRERYERLIRFLIKGGAPLGGIGVQCHFGQNLTPPQRVINILQRLSELNCKLAVTELDISVPNPEIQAQYMHDFLIAAFSVPDVVGINQWGFWAGRHWRPKAALWSKSWQLRPVGKAYINLVYHTWWTNEKAIASPAGLYETRGFLGDYRITASSGAKKAKAVSTNITLGHGGTRVTLRLPGTAKP